MPSAPSGLVNSRTHQTAVSRLRRCSTPRTPDTDLSTLLLANRRIGPYMTHRNSRRGRATDSHVPAYRLMPQPLLHGLVSLCRLTALRCSCSELLQAGYRRSAAPRTPRRWPVASALADSMSLSAWATPHRERLRASGAQSARMALLALSMLTAFQ